MLGMNIEYTLEYSPESRIYFLLTIRKSTWSLVGGVAQRCATPGILGQGLTGTTSVTFNGVAATSFKVGSAPFMTPVVPIGATTDPVVVPTPGCTLTSTRSVRALHYRSH